MKIRITLTANAGVIVNSDVCFTIDALHSIKSSVFPSLSAEMTEAAFGLLDRTPPAAVLVTHEHADHYSRMLTSAALKRYPGSALIFPASIRAGRGKYRGEGYSVSWYPLPHAAVSGFEQVPNYGFLVETGGRTVFTPGDADPLARETLETVRGLRPDIALLNFTWAARRSNRQALELLDPGQAVLVHLPFPEADPCGYNAAARLAVREYCPGAVILSGFLQSADFSL